MSILEQDQDVRLKIAEHLASKGIKKAFVAGQVKVSKSHFNEILNCKRVLTEALLEKINTVLETSFKHPVQDSELKAPATASANTNSVIHH